MSKTNKIAELTESEYAEFGMRVAATLGAAANWDESGDLLEDFAGFATRYLSASIANPDNNADWRKVADKLADVYYDGEDWD